jgi:malate permease and related proteins
MDTPSFYQYFFALIPLLLVMVLGGWFRHLGKMDSHGDSTILWLVIHLLSPCLIIDSILGNRSLDNLGNVIVAPLVGFATVLIGVFLAYFGARAGGIKSREQMGTFISCVSLYNYGYFPVPIIMAFFDRDILGMLFLFNVGLETALWTVGVISLTGASLSSIKTNIKHIINPPLLAVIFSLIVNAIFHGNPLPFGATRIIHMLGQATIPMALLVVGATVFDHVPHIQFFKPFPPLLSSLVFRLFFIPLTFIALAYYLPLPLPLKTVLCIQAGMPSAVLPIIMIRQYGGDLQLAIRIIVASNVVAMITMPLWLSLTI